MFFRQSGFFVQNSVILAIVLLKDINLQISEIRVMPLGSLKNAAWQRIP
jgi:hypothetical protein